MLAKLVLSCVALSAVLLAAQQPTAPPQINAAPATPLQKLPVDPVILTAKILGSYYHPDNLPGLDCDVSLDWPAFITSAKLVVSPDRMQALQALKIHVTALRGETPEIVFNWSGDRIATANQVEAGLRQSIGGYFQVYWSMFASPPIRGAADISKIEPQSDGSEKVYAADSNTHTVVTVDEDGLPTNYTFDTPVMSGTIDAHYLPSPHPVPGDLRRLTGIDIDEQTGASTMKVSLKVDYQPLDNYFVPRNVSFQMIGAYTITMNYSGCTVMSAPVAGE